MKLKTTFSEIREIAEGMPLVNKFYSERWKDTIDRVPTFIELEKVKALRNSYEMDFIIMDKVNDKDEEFDDVRSDTLMVFKMFFSALLSERLVDYDSITYDFITDNQLVGWRVSNVKIYELNNC